MPWHNRIPLTRRQQTEPIHDGPLATGILLERIEQLRLYIHRLEKAKRQLERRLQLAEQRKTEVIE